MKNPFKGLFNKSDPEPTGKKSAEYSVVPGTFLHYVLSGGSYISARQAAGFYRNTASVATAVDMIGDPISQIEPVIQKADGSFESDSPVLDFLKSPNGFYRQQNFLEALAKNYLLKHDSLITSAGNVRRQPIEAWPATLQEMSVMEGSDNYPSKYLVTQGPIRGSFVRVEQRNDFKVRFYDGALKEVYHIMGYSSRVQKTESDSPLQAAANEARQLIKGKKHNLTMLDNGGRLSLLIAFKDEGSEGLEDDEHQERVKRINEQYGGSNNAGKIGVISNADISEIKEFGTTNKDMDYAALEQAASLSVYLRYKIPLPLVTNDASTFNNMETAIALLYDNAVLPNADVIFSGLTDFLMPRFGIDPLQEKITYNPESIDALKRRTLEEVELRKKIGVETINEIRSQLPGREPIENGDTLYQPANLVPVGEDLFTEDNNDT
jgi:phage portal protein BeeE